MARRRRGAKGGRGRGYLTSLGLLGALPWPSSPGPSGTGRGPFGNSWFRRSQGRLRELCGGGRENLRSRGWGVGGLGGSWSGLGKAPLLRTLVFRSEFSHPDSGAASLAGSPQPQKAKKKNKEKQSHASRTVLVEEAPGGPSAYLKPSALGMKRLGLGGSLWQRGTLTGRGLFLAAGKTPNVKTPVCHGPPETLLALFSRLIRHRQFSFEHRPIPISSR